MTRDRLFLAAAVALASVAADAGPAWPQEPEVVVKAVPLGVLADSEKALRDVESLIGIPVFNALNEEIAEIDSLLVQGDSIVYARLGLGGFLFFGGEQLTVPFSVLSFRETTDTGRETTLEAVIETVRTPDHLRALVQRGPLQSGEATE